MEDKDKFREQLLKELHKLRKLLDIDNLPEQIELAREKIC